MLSFTLIILKDPELLTSINDYTSQKITWPAVSKIKDYKTSWFSKNVHTDKEIDIETTRAFPPKYCSWDELEDTLNNLESSHALIVKEGNIFDVDLFPDFIFNTIGVDDTMNYSLIAHLLDKKERYYRVHPQVILLNVDHWKKVGSPTFARAKNVTLQNTERSDENFHDDYTPLWVKKGEGKTTYTDTTGQGSQVISALLENDYKIRPFQEKERNLKRCCYDSEKDQISRIFHYLGNPARMSSDVVYINQTSARPKQFENNNDLIVSVASPLNLLSRIKDNYKNINNVIFYDISSPALIWTELFFKYIKKYNYELEPLYRFFVECGGEKFVFDDVIKIAIYVIIFLIILGLIVYLILQSGKMNKMNLVSKSNESKFGKLEDQIRDNAEKMQREQYIRSRQEKTTLSSVPPQPKEPPKTPEEITFGKYEEMIENYKEALDNFSKVAAFKQKWKGLALTRKERQDGTKTVLINSSRAFEKSEIWCMNFDDRYFALPGSSVKSNMAAYMNLDFEKAQRDFKGVFNITSGSNYFTEVALLRRGGAGFVVEKIGKLQFPQ